jgi:hypothetical protein
MRLSEATHSLKILPFARPAAGLGFAWCPLSLPDHFRFLQQALVDLDSRFDAKQPRYIKKKLELEEVRNKIFLLGNHF